MNHGLQFLDTPRAQSPCCIVASTSLWLSMRADGYGTNGTDVAFYIPTGSVVIACYSLPSCPACFFWRLALMKRSWTIPWASCPPVGGPRGQGMAKNPKIAEKIRKYGIESQFHAFVRFCNWVYNWVVKMQWIKALGPRDPYLEWWLNDPYRSMSWKHSCRNLFFSHRKPNILRWSRCVVLLSIWCSSEKAWHLALAKNGFDFFYETLKFLHFFFPDHVQPMLGVSFYLGGSIPSCELTWVFFKYPMWSWLKHVETLISIRNLLIDSPI